MPDLVFHPRLFSCVLRAFPEGDLNYTTPKVDTVWVLNMDTATLPRQAALSHLAGGMGQGSFSQTSWPSGAFACLPGGACGRHCHSPLMASALIGRLGPMELSGSRLVPWPP